MMAYDFFCHARHDKGQHVHYVFFPLWRGPKSCRMTNDTFGVQKCTM
jgi:hypothetical protein